MLTAENKLRRIAFVLYRDESAPYFQLDTWYANRRGFGGKPIVGYRLTQCEDDKKTILFEGEDFCCSPMYAIDSDENIAGIMGFLTLRPGDTDAEYFGNYTDVQLEFCGKHAESLAMEVMNRFGEG